jgi:hypothetical protein
MCFVLDGFWAGGAFRQKFDVAGLSGHHRSSFGLGELLNDWRWFGLFG